MRVLYCTDTYPPQMNGVSIVCALSASGLRRHGWAAAVAAPRYPVGVADQTSARGEDELVTLASMALPLYPETRIAVPHLGAITSLVARFQPDIIHCQTEFVIGRLGQIAGARAGIPVVTSYHTDFAKYANAYGMPWLSRFVSAHVGRFHRRGQRTYTPSGPARDYLRSIGVSEVEVWGRGVDTTSFHPRRRDDALRARLGLGDAFTFVHVGRLAPEKGVDRILAAYELARRSIVRPTRLVIAGDGPAASELKSSARDDVIFLGYLDRRNDLPTLYASCDAFAFASLTETLGLVVLEAMASGLPAIAAPAGGVADHLRDQQNGLAYPPDDVPAMAARMVELAMDPESTRQLGDGARRTAVALSWDSEIARLDRSYREVIAAARGARQAA
jgi:phosphatidylinositol alpha 1,6-mannosyltransferase